MKSLQEISDRWFVFFWDERFMEEDGTCSRTVSKSFDSEVEARRWCDERHDRWIELGSERIEIES